MLRKSPCPETLKTTAGTLLFGAGLFILFGHVMWAASEWSHLLRGMGESFGILSSVILASSRGEQQLVHDLLRVLSPLLLVAAGWALLRTGATT